MDYELAFNGAGYYVTRLGGQRQSTSVLPQLEGDIFLVRAHALPDPRIRLHPDKLAISV